ncbi:MAG TPA: Gfo/Idh/MocA family oxidoreductase [Humisphaera sp.]
MQSSGNPQATGPVPSSDPTTTAAGTPASGVSRRDVLKMSSAAAIAAAIAAGPLASGVYAQASDTLKYGLIGCGGRGSGAAANAMKAGGDERKNKLVAMGDLFPDRLESSYKNLKEEWGESMDIPDNRKFSGLDAYKAVIDASDVVLLATPPHFRPLHLAAALAANKHVFCEKPVGTDVPSVFKVMELCEVAKGKNLNVVSGLCYRYDLDKRETMKRVHDGEIGDIVSLQGMYNTGGLWMNPRKPGQGDMEWQLRNWLYFTWLSGDHIVEQHIHTLDKMLWTMKDVPPSRCTAVGGRTQRISPEYGHVFDHFATVYEWDTDRGPVRAFCQTRQWKDVAVDVSDWVFGTKGLANLGQHYLASYEKPDEAKAKGLVAGSPGTPAPGGGTHIWKKKTKGPNFYDYEHVELARAIRTGKTINNGDYMCKSTLMGIMGRFAAYTGETIYWDREAVKRAGPTAGKNAKVLLESKQDLTPPTYDLKAAYPTAPVAIPGENWKFA